MKFISLFSPLETGGRINENVVTLDNLRRSDNIFGLEAATSAQSGA